MFDDPDGLYFTEPEEDRVFVQYQRDLKSVLDTEAGRNVMWALLERIGIFTEPFCGEQTHQSAFEMGRRSVGRMMLAHILDADKDAYAKMLAEKMDAKLFLDKEK